MTTHKRLSKESYNMSTFTATGTSNLCQRLAGLNTVQAGFE